MDTPQTPAKRNAPAAPAINKDKVSKPKAWAEQADEYARQEPTKAVIAAFGAGFLINLLPLGAITGAATSTAFSLVRPALLFLGLIKAADLIRNRLDQPQPSGR